MNFCWSSSFIIQSIHNMVQKVGTHISAAASMTLTREHQLWQSSWGEPCTLRQQFGERPLPSQKSKRKQLMGSPILSAISASRSAFTRLPPECLITRMLFLQQNKPVSLSSGGSSLEKAILLEGNDF